MKPWKGKKAILLRALGLMAAAFIILLVLMLWGSHIPKRPANISSRGAFLEVGSVPFKLSTHGDWLECWKDENANMDRCKYTDEKGTVPIRRLRSALRGILSRL